jgi:hypothetical protein
MIKENVTFTCRVANNDQTEQRTVTMAYCYATEIAYKELADEDITSIIQEIIAGVNENPQRLPDIKRRIKLILAAITAFYDEAGKEAPVTDSDLMFHATPMEMDTALAIILTMWAKFYHLPVGEPTDKVPSDSPAGSEDGSKN